MDMETALELGTLRTQIATVNQILDLADTEGNGTVTTELIRQALTSAKKQFALNALEWVHKQKGD